ncbi:Ankyrin repeat protein 1 [Giardia muris]|uniref:Ankyrin repeat protein 1 n=1 Tax=Giardia muris TaxID=5742 RepID=A0A4Z1SZ40_GIAMU|nr:Ankyrin repeat protein 1 [Giardia muris]|eukprot:TNJ30035.1 Ankyrin repeat protein 1 [Giardia muris]
MTTEDESGCRLVDLGTDRHSPNLRLFRALAHSHHPCLALPIETTDADVVQYSIDMSTLDVWPTLAQVLIKYRMEGKSFAEDEIWRVISQLLSVLNFLENLDIQSLCRPSDQPVITTATCSGIFFTWTMMAKPFMLQNILEVENIATDSSDDEEGQRGLAFTCLSLDAIHLDPDYRVLINPAATFQHPVLTPQENRERGPPGPSSNVWDVAFVVKALMSTSLCSSQTWSKDLLSFISDCTQDFLKRPSPNALFRRSSITRSLRELAIQTSYDALFWAQEVALWSPTQQLIDDTLLISLPKTDMKLLLEQTLRIQIQYDEVDGILRTLTYARDLRYQLHVAGRPGINILKPSRLMRAVQASDITSIRQERNHLRKIYRDRTALSYAIALKDESIIQLLLSELGLQDPHGCTTLMHAAIEGHPVGWLLCETGIRDQNGRTALMHATQAGQDAIVATLIDHELKMQDNEGMTALITGVQNGQTKCCAYLLQETGIYDSGGRTALVHALVQNRTPLVALLAPWEYDYPTRDSFHYDPICNGPNWPPLLLAYYLQAYDAIEILERYPSKDQIPELVYDIITGSDTLELDISMHVNDCTEQGWSALMWAAAVGDARMVELLLRLKANTTGALKVAIYRGHLKCVQLLRNTLSREETHSFITHISGPHILRDDVKRCVYALETCTLIRAALMGDVTLITEQLEQVSEENGAILLSLILEYKDPQLALLVCRSLPLGVYIQPRPYEPDVEVHYDENYVLGGLSLLMKAAYEGDVMGLRGNLLELGRQNRVDDLKTALIYAVSQNFNEELSLLLPEAQLRDAHGRSALTYAVQCGNTEAARVLARDVSLITSKDQQGRTPLDLARESVEGAAILTRSRYQCAQLFEAMIARSQEALA